VQRKVKQDHKLPIRNVFYGEKSSIAPKSNPKLIPLAIGPCINFLGTFGGLQSAQQCIMNAAEILAFTTQALPAWRTSPIYSAAFRISAQVQNNRNKRKIKGQHQSLTFSAKTEGGGPTISG